MSKIPPVLLSAVLCDRVIFDKVTSMPSLINILQVLNAPKFPVRTGQMVFFCELTNGHGKTKTKVRLIDSSDNEKVLFEKGGTVDFKDVRQVLTLAVALQGVVFAHPGEYRFQILAEETLLGERSILCRQINIPPKGEQQGPAMM